MHIPSTPQSADIAMRVFTAQQAAKSAESTTFALPQPAVSHEHEVKVPETKESTSRLSYRRSERTTLYIETQEGDVVRLKFSARESANIKILQTGDAEATDLTMKTRSTSKLSVKVRGDLNSEEFAAIQDTIAQAIELANDFFAGDVQAAFEFAAALDIDGEQLAGVRLRMRVSERLTYSAQSFLSVPTIASETSEASDVSTPTVVLSSTPATTAETNEILESTPESAEPVPEDPEGVQEVSSDPLDLFQAISLIRDFLGKILDAVGANDGEGHGGPLHVSLKIRIVQSTLVTLSEARAEEEAPLPELVPETLDVMAAQEEAPPLDQIA